MSEPWRERVKEELRELNLKIYALTEFLQTCTGPYSEGKPSKGHIELLKRQYYHMTEYASVLIERLSS